MLTSWTRQFPQQGRVLGQHTYDLKLGGIVALDMCQPMDVPWRVASQSPTWRRHGRQAN